MSSIEERSGTILLKMSAREFREWTWDIYLQIVKAEVIKGN